MWIHVPAGILAGICIARNTIGREAVCCSRLSELKRQIHSKEFGVNDLARRNAERGGEDGEAVSC